MEKQKQIKIVKRNGDIVDYDRNKIISAITSSNKDVEKEEDKASLTLATDIVMGIELDLLFSTSDYIGVEEIQDLVEIGLMNRKKFKLAKEYIIYREKHSMIRHANTTDKSLVSLIKHTNKEMNEENSNKNVMLISTQRDYVAGITSSDATWRLLLPERIVKAHENGVLHFHDSDYFIQEGMFNCCLINIGDMLDNGTCMNGKMIETPKSFQVACTVMTQIIAAVASNQYGKLFAVVKPI